MRPHPPWSEQGDSLFCVVSEHTQTQYNEDQAPRSAAGEAGWLLGAQARCSKLLEKPLWNKKKGTSLGF